MGKRRRRLSDGRSRPDTRLFRTKLFAQYRSESLLAYGIKITLFSKASHVIFRPMKNESFFYQGSHFSNGHVVWQKQRLRMSMNVFRLWHRSFGQNRDFLFQGCYLDVTFDSPNASRGSNGHLT
jgi:hypothetical protein